MNRYVIEENQMVSPSNTIKCFNCKYKNKSYNGYKKCICEKFDNIETAKNFYKKHSNYFKFITDRENSSIYISKIVFNTEDVEKI